jgi:putative CocE/NonD family hydrolase
MLPSRDRDPSHARYLRDHAARFDGYDRASRYLVMRDGVRIAVDVCLPHGLRAGETIPAIVRQTRYFRRHRVHPALRRVLDEATVDPMNAPMRRLFTSRGYAWIDVDARGSGASFGERPCPWYLEGEVADGAEIVEWIVRQPWSNGRVGSTGVSYEGTTADFLGTARHPAVRAIAPRFALYDVYADVAFPGGLHSAYFTQAWETANAALDRNAPGEMIALIHSLQAHGMADARVTEPGTLPNAVARIVDRPLVQRAMRNLFTWVLGGVAPVDGAEAELHEALLSHSENFNVHEGALHMTYRDDSPPNARIPGQTSEYFSPHTYASLLHESATPVAVLSYGGWFDGGYAAAAVKRFHALSGRDAETRLLVGPWIHGGLIDMDPDTRGRRATFDHAVELLRFFDRHLRPGAAAGRATPLDEPPVRYFLMGEGRWRTADRWPPEGTQAFELCFSDDRRLIASSSPPSHPSRSGFDVHEVDPSTRAGVRSRWRTLLCPFMHADGKGRSARGWLVYETAPLERTLELVGQPILVLTLASTVSDGAIVAYLEDVDVDGEARLLTEGVLRTVHRTRLAEPDGRPPHVEATFLRADALRVHPGEPVTHAIELLPTAFVVRRRHRLRLSLGGADLDHFATPSAGARVEWRVDRARSKLLLPVLSNP